MKMTPLDKLTVLAIICFLSGLGECCGLRSSSVPEIDDCLVADARWASSTSQREQLESTVLQILDSLQWRDVVLITDSSDYFLHQSAVFSGEETKLSMFGIDLCHLQEEVHRVFSDINKHTSLRIVVLCTHKCLLEILKQAHSFDEASGQQGYFTYLHKWIIITNVKCEPDIEQSAHSITNLAVIAWERYGRWPLKVSTATWTTNRKRELITVATLRQKTLLDLFNRTLQPSCSGCDALNEDTLFPGLKYGLNGQHLIVSTNIWPPFVYLSKNGTKKYTGFCIEVLKFISQHFNFTYSITQPADGQWGGVDTNGSWTGLIGQLARHRVDMVSAPLGMFLEREMVVDFTETAMYMEEFRIMIKIFDQEESSLQFLAKPFKSWVWACIGLSIIVGALGMWLLNKLCRNFVEPNHEDKENQKLHLFLKSVWFGVGSQIKQGTVFIPRNHSVRIFASAWWFYCVVICAAYTANLVAYMVVVKVTVPFATLEEMLEQDKYVFGTLGGTYLVAVMMMGRSNLLKDTWVKMQGFVDNGQTYVLSMNHSLHVHKMKTSHYAYLADATSLAFAAQGDCSLKMLPRSLFEPMRYSIILQNNSAYRKPLNDALIAARDSGLFQQWKEMHWPKTMAAGCKQDSGLPPAVSINQISGILVAMGYMLFGCAVVLIAEIVAQKAVQRYKKQQGLS